MALGRLRLKEKKYDFPPYRPPSEAYSLLVRVTRGCPWNKCLFCSMYKDIPFEQRPIEDIRRDIANAAEILRGEATYAFIGDSNSLIVNAETLFEVLKALYSYFPKLERVTSYARAKTILKKDTSELHQLRRQGLIRLHVGLESGDEQTLAFIHKGATPEEMIEAGKKAKEIGFELSLYILLGIGGINSWERHADATARVLNEINPDFIRVRTITPQRGSPLYSLLAQGSFVLPPPDIILEEEKRLIERLEVTSHFLSDHISNYLSINGALPKDKEAMVKTINDELYFMRSCPALMKKYERKRYLQRL